MKFSEVKDIATVASFEITDSYHSRRALLWLILYLMGVILAVLIFITVLHQIELQVAKAVAVDGTSKPGVMTGEIWKSSQFRDIVRKLVDDDSLADTLIHTPPLALFYGWFSLTFAPLLVILLASENISNELSTGAARFILFRTTKARWSIGKFAGIAVLLLIVLAFGAACGTILGWFRLKNMQLTATMVSISIMTLKTWIYSLSFLGLALGISQATKSVALARTMGLTAYLAFSILSKVSEVYSGSGIQRLWELVHILIPNSHGLNLWYNDFTHGGRALLIVLILGCFYFFLGYILFEKRDA